MSQQGIAAAASNPPAETPPYIAVESNGMPRASSTFAENIDNVYWTWIWIAIPFFIVVIFPMIYFAFKYKRKREDEPTSPIDHNIQLETAWTVVPTVLLIYLFWVGITAYLDASVAPNESYEIKVTGQMFNWTFEYPDGTITNELGIPKGKPIKLIMSSKDVIHSFFVPEFRAKQDVVPGLYTSLWFQATRETETAVECAEYCGDGHSRMLTKVFVMPSGNLDQKGTFEYWLDQGGLMEPLPPIALGQKRVNALCTSCHSLDGSRIQGPSFKGLFGRKEKLVGGKEIVVDENYIRRSILEPQADLVDGYPATMPTFAGQLKDKDIEGIIAFLKEQK